MRSRRDSARHLEVDQPVSRGQAVARQELAEGRRQAFRIRSTDPHGAQAPGEALEVPLRLEQHSAVGSQNLVHAVREQESAIVGRDPH